MYYVAIRMPSMIKIRWCNESAVKLKRPITTRIWIGKNVKEQLGLLWYIQYEVSSKNIYFLIYDNNIPLMPLLLQVSHVLRRGLSLGITLPKGIREKLGLNEGDILGFYEEDGKILLKKIDWNQRFQHRFSGHDFNVPDEFKVNQEAWMIPVSHHDNSARIREEYGLKWFL